MAEAAAVASILGIASFGIQLTQTLYTFGCNVSSAREETNYIARHVDLYSNVLDILTDRLEDDEPILSGAAFDLIDELQYQSQELFKKIEHSLPNPKDGKDDISFLQKVKWNFTKSRVALLVGELDYLRSTVHLLVTIIFTGRRIRSRRKRKARSDKEGAADPDNELGKQGVKAQNALLAQQEAQDKLPELEKEATRQESLGRNGAIQPYTQRPDTRTDVIRAKAPALHNLQQSLTTCADPAERQRLVLQHSARVLRQLLEQWTTVGLERPLGRDDEAHARPGGQQQPTAELARNKTTPSPPPRFPCATSFPDHTKAHTFEGPKVSPGVHSTPESAVSLPDQWRGMSTCAPKMFKDWLATLPEADEAPPPEWTKALNKDNGLPDYYGSKSSNSQWESHAPEAPNWNAGERFAQFFSDGFDTRAENACAQSSGVGAFGTNILYYSTEDGKQKRSGRRHGDKSTSKDGDLNKGSRSLRRPRTQDNACRSCEGRGGRVDKAKKCQECVGFGYLLDQHFGSDLAVSCRGCNGEGSTIPVRYQCQVCIGTGILPRSDLSEHKSGLYGEVNRKERPA
ncbi:hypothetical protein EDD37DRAFT_185959 [Exophiala viscosa]|uniref:Fungal N-terminal domain-containing protein n=1 Tax=Exophiala viscosa TaxID=2486360 RepID=A0AAN6DKS0_9EURO|nr:hypothetical protein EDD36DRAFT_107924 [Exophiala viscosa]KAI1620095.1 hypothetical protein EDD37DRAFT_185959 [Exophiala viscosa]